MNRLLSFSPLKQDFIAGLYAYLTAMPVILISYFLILNIYQEQYPVLPLLCISTGIVTLAWSIYNRTPVVFLPNISIISMLVFSMYWGDAISTNQLFIILGVAGICLFILGLLKIGYKIEKALPAFFPNAIIVCLGFLLISTGFRLSGLIVSHPVTYSVMGSLTTRAAIVVGSGLVCFLFVWCMSWKLAHLWGLAGVIITGGLLGTMGHSLNAATLTKIDLFVPELNGALTEIIFLAPGLYYIILLETIIIGLAVGGIWSDRRNLNQVMTVSGAGGLIFSIFGIPGPMPAAEGLGSSVEEGSTGKSGIVSGSLFIASGLFLSVIDYTGNGMLVGPNERVYPIGATLLIILGIKLLTRFRNINFHNTQEALVVLSMSAITIISNSLIIGFGVGLGLFLGYSILKREFSSVHIISVILTILFIIKILV